MVPENILWAFFSPAHYQRMRDESALDKTPVPNDVYYKDFSGKWVKVTATFDCIEKARRDYRYNDAKYLGGVLADTKGEVARGGVYPPVPVDPNKPVEPRALKKKKRLNKPQGQPGSITVNKPKVTWADPYYDIPRPYRGFTTYGDGW